jgi:hypothetical protein
MRAARVNCGLLDVFRILSKDRSLGSEFYRTGEANADGYGSIRRRFEGRVVRSSERGVQMLSAL